MKLSIQIVTEKNKLESIRLTPIMKRTYKNHLDIFCRQLNRS